MRTFFCALILSACAGIALPVCADGAEFAGQMLSDYLDELNERGQTVIYSSDLVGDRMWLVSEPPVAPGLTELQIGRAHV